MRECRGMTMRMCMITTDPRVRFRLPNGKVATAEAIARTPKVVDSIGGEIYAAYEDEDGHVNIGIAPSSDEGISEWIAEQIKYPVIRSIDRVDLLGNVIPKEQS